jgi:hypothetical protein
MSEPVLCFVKDNCAYFTTQKLEDQWGCDWGDRPYEHNASRPNEPGKSDIDKGNTWEITKVYYDGDFETPAEIAGFNSSYSVEDINAGYVPWLVTSRWTDMPRKIVINAGCPLTDFKSAIKLGGGKVYTEEVE